MKLILTLLMQAALPPSGLQYYARTEYHGLGLVCGAAFSILLGENEAAVLSKRSFIDEETNFRTRDGQFTVRESQYGARDSKIVKKLANGALSVKRRKSGFVWIFSDNAPGATEVYGPAVNTRKPSAALARVKFNSPRDGFADNEKCLAGVRSDKKIS